ncbi:chaperone NapD [Deferribacter abyssi]|uniref:chaperone NapD n=1 Tax=Deferribacter abyssi TaxID=213806 RepID=UPI003C240B60
MLYCGCIIFVKDKQFKKVEEVVLKYKEITVYTKSEDNQLLVVTIEAETDKQIEKLINELKQYEYIIDISPHYLHFEEEVERILKTGEKPDLTGFSKSERRKATHEN